MINSGRSQYGISVKADGARGLLCIYNSDIHIIDNKGSRIHSKLNNSDLHGTVLDVEILDSGDIYAFDCLCINNRNIMGTTLSERYNQLNTTIDTLHDKNSRIKLKKLFFTGVMSNDLKNAQNNANDEFKTNNDGFIFVNMQGGYNSEQYKFKPPDQISIDFKVRRDNNKMLELYTFNINTKREIMYKKQGFKNPIKPPPDNIDYGKINDDDIVEFTYVKGSLQFYRNRTQSDGKKYPNKSNVVDDNWYDMINPMPIEAVFTHIQNIQGDTIDDYFYIIGEHIAEYCVKDYNEGLISLSQNLSICCLGSGFSIEQPCVKNTAEFLQTHLTRLLLIDPNKNMYTQVEKDIKEIILNGDKQVNIRLMEGKNYLNEIDVAGVVREESYNILTLYYTLNSISSVKDIHLLCRTLNTLVYTKDSYITGCYMVMGDDMQIGSSTHLKKIDDRKYSISQGEEKEQTLYVAQFQVFKIEMERYGFEVIVDIKINGIIQYFSLKRKENRYEKKILLHVDTVQLLDSNIFDTDSKKSVELYRTGVPPDGSCLLHSIHKSLDNNTNEDVYREKATQLRRKLVEYIERNPEAVTEKYKLLKKMHIKNYGTFLGLKEVQFIMDFMKVNIIFINDSTRTFLVPSGTFTFDRSNKYILVYHIDSIHFEPLHIKTEDGGDKYVFTGSDRIIEQMLLYTRVNFQKKDTHTKKVSVRALEYMRKYHNSEKSTLIKDNVKRGCTVLDLGSGRGGDIFKYIRQQPSNLLLLEPNEDNFKEMKNRIVENNWEKKNPNMKFNPFIAEAQQVDDILRELGLIQPPTKADVISMFFILTFFFDSEETLNRLINTLKTTINPGGKVIGTTMDGRLTYEYLKGRSVIDNAFYQITKHYDDRKAVTHSFGNDITININESIVKEQKEYLVDFNLFISKMEEAGFELDTCHPFNYRTENGPVKDLSNLNRVFSFNHIV